MLQYKVQLQGTPLQFGWIDVTEGQFTVMLVMLVSAGEDWMEGELWHAQVGQVSCTAVWDFGLIDTFIHYILCHLSLTLYYVTYHSLYIMLQIPHYI